MRKIIETLEIIEPIDMAHEFVEVQCVQATDLQPRPKRSFNVDLTISDSTKRALEMAGSVAVGFSGWLIVGVAKVSGKILIVVGAGLYLVVGSVLRGVSRGISHQLNKGFIDYDWSHKEEAKQGSKGRFEHTTTFENITIKVTKH